MRKIVVSAAVLAGLVMTSSLAWAQDPLTKGVPVQQANAACAGIVGEERPGAFDTAVAAYNTVDNTDDGAFSAIPVEWQKFIIAVEDHADYLEMTGLERGSITCDGRVAVFPNLELAGDVVAAICDHERLDLIASPTAKGRVQAGLEALGRSYTDAREECEPEPTQTPEPSPTPEPTRDVFNCADFSTRADAQAKFNEDVSDPHNLDSDGNGRACERHFDENVGVQDEDDILDENVVTPSGGVATGGGPA